MIPRAVSVTEIEVGRESGTNLQPSGSAEIKAGTHMENGEAAVAQR